MGHLRVTHAPLVGTVHLLVIKIMERVCNAPMAGHHCCQDPKTVCPAQLGHILLLVELHVLRVNLGRSGISLWLPVPTAQLATILPQLEGAWSLCMLRAQSALQVNLHQLFGLIVH